MMLAVTFERLCIQTPAEVVCIDNPVFAFSFETSAFGKMCIRDRLVEGIFSICFRTGIIPMKYWKRGLKEMSDKTILEQWRAIAYDPVSYTHLFPERRRQICDP